MWFENEWHVIPNQLVLLIRLVWQNRVGHNFGASRKPDFHAGVYHDVDEDGQQEALRWRNHRSVLYSGIIQQRCHVEQRLFEEKRHALRDQAQRMSRQELKVHQHSPLVVPSEKKKNLPASGVSTYRRRSSLPRIKKPDLRKEEVAMSREDDTGSGYATPTSSEAQPADPDYEAFPQFSPSSVSRPSTPSPRPPSQKPSARRALDDQFAKATWTAEDLLMALRSLSSSDMLRVQGEMCRGSPFVVVFYASPSNDARGRLKLEQEMNETLEISNFTERIFIVPVTTETGFRTYLRRYKPSVFCFVGHCDDTHVGMCDERNRLAAVDIERVASLIREAYGAEMHKLTCVCLFACKTEALALRIREQTSSPPQTTPQPSVIYWKTQTENNACRQFANYIIRALVQIEENHDDPDESARRGKVDAQIRSDIVNIFNGACALLENNRMTLEDPEPYLKDYGTHEDRFKEFIRDRMARLQSGNLCTFFYAENPQLDIQKVRFQHCTHCNPHRHGKPAIMHDGVELTFRSRA